VIPRVAGDVAWGQFAAGGLDRAGDSATAGRNGGAGIGVARAGPGGVEEARAVSPPVPWPVASTAVPGTGRGPRGAVRPGPRRAPCPCPERRHTGERQIGRAHV